MKKYLQLLWALVLAYASRAQDPAYPPAPSPAGNIVAAEYFIDTDPGPGAGTAIAVIAGVDVSNAAVTVNTAALANGTHRLYIRTRNAAGVWSLAAEQDFIIDFTVNYPTAPAAAGDVVAGEYFFDSDPGLGAGTVISVTPGADLADVSFVANTSGLSIGTHRLYVRTRGAEGRWSLTAVREIVVNIDYSYPAAPVAAGSLVGAEYFFDTDPGSGNGTAVSVTPGVDLSGVTVAVNTSALTQGQHTLYFRTRDAAGVWSLTRRDSVYVGVQAASWALDPATGHDFGSVASGTPVNFIFSVRNTGGQAIVLRNAFVSDPAFTVGFTPGTTIAAGGSVQLPVTFTPTGVSTFTGLVKVVSDPGGPDTVYATVLGKGYVTGTPPSVTYVASAPYNGVSGVNATVGQTGNYTYKIIYRSADGRAPGTGYPTLGIDRNGDGDFDDANEGQYTMTKEGAGSDYTAGVVYSLTVNHPDYSSTLGYQFFAVDDLGNTAGSGNTAYKSGPTVTLDLLDLKIFANDINFSKTNPLPGESFTMTANITNSSAYNVTNVPVKFYKDTILIGSAVVPAINAFSSATLTQVFNFATDGFYPIKVWVDSARMLTESNYLNNYAIRPINIGKVVLPGGIHVTTTASLQSCPQAVVVSGTAVYFGVATPTAAAGAQVTINTGTSTYTTTTDGGGNYSLLINNPVCGGTLAYTVTVTDFTFTSNAVAGSIAVPCPAPGACVVQPQPGVSLVSQFSTNPCSQITGSQGEIQISVTYRARNLANFWNAWDQILKDTVRVFQNGQQIAVFGSADGTTSPGMTKVLPVTVTLDANGPNVIEARQSYVYNEFFQIPDNFYKGMFIPMGGTATTTLVAEENMPDLTISDFSQSTLTSFAFADVNLRCGDAGSHTVQLWDSVSGGVRVLLKSFTVSSLSGKTQRMLSYSDAAMVPGDHFIKIITDAGGTVNELDETNNVFVTTVNVPKPDLSVGVINPVGAGGAVKFNATIMNTGKASGPFNVAFRANGVPIGALVRVSAAPEKGSVSVVSDTWTVPTADKDCPVAITVSADASSEIDESVESNNDGSLGYASDLAAYMVSGEPGSASNPVVVRINDAVVLHPAIRNIGARDVSNVTVRYSTGGVWAGNELVGLVRAGEAFAAAGTLTHTFTAVGDHVVTVEADTSNTICEVSESNNAGSFFVKVVDANPDLEVLSQYISPSSLNPNPGQSISIVGTVKNVGFKASTPNVLRFMVDDIQLGNDVTLNALAPGRDTTVAATAGYSSVITGTKIMKIIVNPARSMAEEQFGNNEATRALIVGDAPDMARAHALAIGFNPSGFASGDSVVVNYAVKNNGSQDGVAWVRFRILDATGALTAVDSMEFSLAAGLTGTVSRKMLFSVDAGTVIAEIYNCSPMEFDLFNNSDSLVFTTTMKLKAAVSVSGDLDMKDGLPSQLPGWIGGKLVLGNYDLVVNGKVVNFDMDHFVVTSGTGRLKLVNTNAANIYPVGAGLTSPNFVKINNTGVADNFSVGVVPYVLRGGVGGDTVRTLGVNRTWLIDEAIAGGSHASVELFWSHADELMAFDGTTSRLAHFKNGWQLGDPGQALADTNGQLSRIQSGYTSFSPFTVISGSGTELPLQLLKFAASRAGSDVRLDWETTNEVNTAVFMIEHSIDGVTFVSLGTVAAENAAGIHDYHWTHERAGEGLHYYRLKMTDLDGTATYSEVKAIRMEAGGDLRIYPNPAEQFILVSGMMPSPGGLVDIVTMDGRVVRRIVPSGPSMTIDLGRLAAGSYYLRYAVGDRVQTQRFVKK